jgi:D-serine deaminase-like pyridoxal phosphate-dependent protein
MAWYDLENAGELPSPALVLHAERIAENVRRMLALAGGPERLRPHIKTHKLPQLIWRQLDLGIRKFKCATIAEAEMAALAGAPEILLAMQPVGANARRFAQLAARFPNALLQTIVDDEGAAAELTRAAQECACTVETLVDLDVGQRRTGIAPGANAAALYQFIAAQPNLIPGGLHAYDGHLHQSDPAERAAACDAAFAPVRQLRDELSAAGLDVPRIVAGGTPTFPMHARSGDVECSPGTCVLWDAGYAEKMPDLDFLPAAVLFCRIVSKPSSGLLCLDLGHKAVGSEMPHPRAVFPDIPDARAVAHNEEHLVLATAEAGRFRVGDALHAIPWHICPTVALHSEVWVAQQGIVTESWPVVGRARRLTI